MEYFKRLFLGRLNRKSFFVGFLIVMTAYMLAQPLGLGAAYGAGTDDITQTYAIIPYIPLSYLIYDFSSFYRADPIRFPLWCIFTYGFITLAVFLCVRRLHDIGRSGLYSLLWILFLLLIGYCWWIVYFLPPMLIILVVFFCPLILTLIPGKQKSNKYGKPPEPKINI